MQGHKLLHNLFLKTFNFIHKKRGLALLDSVEALLIGKKLSLSHLGRNLQSVTKERNCIRKMDRLLGNKHLHRETADCYQAMCVLILSKIKKPIISVDWAAINKKKDWHILRASLNIEGRGLILYQEVHPQSKANSPEVQNKFLDKLKAMIPNDCKPIIVADAGFRFPWFKKVKSIGFDFVGRVRNKTGYRRLENDDWHNNCLDLYEKATPQAVYLGKFFFKKSDAIESKVVLYKKKKKLRKHINRSGNPTNNTQSNRCARRQQDPWLLVTSLDVETFGAQKIVMIYAKRMQIEEDFRDLKSHQFGFSLRYCMSNNQKRIAVLLLIASISSLYCWLIALSAKKINLHRDFQSNSIRHRNVISIIYLGCQLVRRYIIFSFRELKDAYFTLQKIILESSLC